MQSKVVSFTNGVDVGRLTETVAAVKAAPALGSFQFRVQNRWIDGGYNRSEVQPFSAGGKEIQHKTGFRLAADEPDILLGADQGANPVEHLLHALASCVTTSMVYHAAARGIAIEQVDSTLEGDLDLRGFLDLSPNVRKGYQNIRMKLRIKADVSDEQLQELSSLGPTFSPVYDSITRGVRVAVSAERMK
ncbi:MAG: osmotically inducible protein C [Acidobacteria bacterium]|nr:MAG: osmotically inducible protein C [Acidobacteriota bacterium]